MSRDQTIRSPRSRPCPPWLLIEELPNADETLVLRLEGELDLASGEHLRQRLRQLQRAGTPTILDLSGITFIDCGGLRVVLWALETARNEGTRFELSPQHSAPLRRLLELTGNRSGSILRPDRSP